MELDDGPTLPAGARIVAYDASKDVSIVEISIREGRKRQIRRMFAKVGHRVINLKRTKIGNIRIDGLAEGSVRHLSKKELKSLERLAAR